MNQSARARGAAHRETRRLLSVVVVVVASKSRYYFSPDTRLSTSSPSANHIRKYFHSEYVCLCVCVYVPGRSYYQKNWHILQRCSTDVRSPTYTQRSKNAAAPLLLCKFSVLALSLVCTRIHMQTYTHTGVGRKRGSERNTDSGSSSSGRAGER